MIGSVRAGSWSVERTRASIASLHDAWPDPSARAGRMIRLCAPVGSSAVVLGSAQDDDVLDARSLRRARVDVVRRGAGGGAVMVAPGAQVWADLWLPRGDRLWVEDVVASSSWVGELWSAALGALGVGDSVVHRGPHITAPWSAAVCFAGLGPGEVTVGGRKVVGVAQRRTRSGARWYTMAPLAWEPAPLLGLLGKTGWPDAQAALEQAAVGLRAVVPDTTEMTDEDLIATVEDAVIAALAS